MDSACHLYLLKTRKVSTTAERSSTESHSPLLSCFLNCITLFLIVELLIKYLIIFSEVVKMSNLSELFEYMLVLEENEDCPFVV
jgi:hypothetical protein